MKKSAGNIILTIVLILIALFALYPIWYTLVVSFSDKTAVESGYVKFWPVGFTFSSYERILKEEAFFTAFWVSIQRVVLGGGVNFIITVMTAYPLSKSKRQFKERNLYMWFLLFTMVFSAGTIPWYMTIRNYGLIDSIWALVLPCAVPVFNVIILMNFYRGLPGEISESAHIDGAGPWTILMKIYIPLSAPAIATVTLFSIVNHWNSYFDGLVLMNKETLYPLQTYIQQMVIVRDYTNMSMEEMQMMATMSNRTLNAAKIFVAMVPILCVYPFLQKYFVSGMTMGAVKE